MTLSIEVGFSRCRFDAILAAAAKVTIPYVVIVQRQVLKVSTVTEGLRLLRPVRRVPHGALRMVELAVSFDSRITAPALRVGRFRLPRHHLFAMSRSHIARHDSLVPLSDTYVQFEWPSVPCDGSTRTTCYRRS